MWGFWQKQSPIVTFSGSSESLYCSPRHRTKEKNNPAAIVLESVLGQREVQKRMKSNLGSRKKKVIIVRYVSNSYVVDDGFMGVCLYLLCSSQPFLKKIIEIFKEYEALFKAQHIRGII